MRKPVILILLLLHLASAQLETNTKGFIETSKTAITKTASSSSIPPMEIRQIIMDNHTLSTSIAISHKFQE